MTPYIDEALVVDSLWMQLQQTPPPRMVQWQRTISAGAPLGKTAPGAVEGARCHKHHGHALTDYCIAHLEQRSHHNCGKQQQYQQQPRPGEDFALRGQCRQTAD
jgi:hypothetical protein